MLPPHVLDFEDCMKKQLNCDIMVGIDYMIIYYSICDLIRIDDVKMLRYSLTLHMTVNMTSHYTRT